MNKPVKVGIFVLVAVIMLSSSIVVFMRNDVKTEPETYQYPTTNLFGLNMMIDEEYTYVEKIIDGVAVECYAVNFYNTTSPSGQFVWYNGMVTELQKKMMGITLSPTFAENVTAIVKGSEIDRSKLTMGRFLDNAIVKAYYEMNCPHLGSIRDVPAEFDDTVGTKAYEMCIKRKMLYTDLDCSNVTGDGSLYSIVFEFEGNFDKYMELNRVLNAEPDT